MATASSTSLATRASEVYLATLPAACAYALCTVLLFSALAAVTRACTQHQTVVTIVSFLSSLLQTFHAEKRECTHGISRFEQHAVNKLCREGHNQGT